MTKEIYEVKCPMHIVFGDPLYFEEYKGTELKRLTVDYRPPKHFNAARLVLQESPNDEYPEYTDRRITLYLAPSQTVEIYADEKIYSSQKTEQKAIGVDTARYYLNIDGRNDEIKTGADGCWGSFEEYYRENGKNRISDAAVLTILMPEDMDFAEMKQLAEYFFEDLKPVISKKGRKKEVPSR